MIFDPFTTSQTLHAQTLADVLAWLATTEDLNDDSRQAYRLAVEWAARIIGKPPSKIPANWEIVLSHFPDHAYTPDLAKTFESFKRKRRSLSCAIRGATGAIAAKRERRTRADGWKRILNRARELTEDGRGLSGFHLKGLIALEVLAQQARVLGCEPHDMCLPIVRRIESHAPDLSEALKKACDICDKLRSLHDPLLDQLLPSMPIAFRPRSKRKPVKLPRALEGELEIWIGVATKGRWSDIDGEITPDDSIKPYRNATRKIISTALEIEYVNLDHVATIASFFENRVLVEVVKTLRAWHLEGDEKSISPKTVRDYLETLKLFLKSNGESSEHVCKILSDSKWLKSPSRREGKMPQRIRSFCRRIVRDKKARLSFLSLHMQFRKKAMANLKAMKRNPARADHYSTLARKYGTLAAFAALMTDAVPTRIGTVLPATFRGKAPWLELGFKRTADGYLCIPAGRVKNGVGIMAPILAQSRFRGLETLRWYLAEIRPLFPHHDRNDFFFPAVKNPKASLGYNTFMSWWTDVIAEAGFAGMTPHMFRHGQVSILIANNPGDWATVAARIGDREDTVREYYAWIDDERLILSGQQKLAEAFLNAA